jgi:hypothetical protein
MRVWRLNAGAHLMQGGNYAGSVDVPDACLCSSALRALFVEMRTLGNTRLFKIEQELIRYALKMNSGFAGLQ